jgi:hypothetical protein
MRARDNIVLLESRSVCPTLMTSLVAGSSGSGLWDVPGLPDIESDARSEDLVLILHDTRRRTSVSEDTTSIEMDKITEILIGEVWHSVSPESLQMVQFDLDPKHRVPGIGFQTGPTTSRRNKEAIYAPLTSVSAVKTLDDARTQQTGS